MSGKFRIFLIFFPGKLKIKIFCARNIKNIDVRVGIQNLLSLLFQIVGEHKDYINSIASQPESGDKVASVSDDHTCCVWSTNDPINQLMCFPLTSPGMNVCWHPKEPAKVELI